MDFRLSGHSINPLQFDPRESAVLKPLGHFLCLDRWGAPTEAEERNGMFFHGEASRVEWRVLKKPARKGDAVETAMSALLPMAGLEVVRTIRLSDSSASCTVSRKGYQQEQAGAYLQYGSASHHRSPVSG